METTQRRVRDGVLWHNTTQIAFTEDHKDYVVVDRFIRVELFQDYGHGGLSTGERKFWESVLGAPVGRLSGIISSMLEPHGVGEHLLRNRSFGK